MLTEEIRSLDAELHAVADTIDTTLINPINAEEIKKNFTGENPAFMYPEKPDLTATIQRLQQLSFPDSPEGAILKKKNQYLLNKVALIMAIGTKEFTQLSKKIHPLPSQELVQQAQEILKKPSVNNTEKVHLIDAFTELQTTIAELGIPWQVKKTNMLASANVIPSQRLLYIKSQSLFTRRFIERLKVHEIGTHAIRAENGRLQPLKIFMHGFADYLATEEGLAAYNEEKFGLLDATVLRTYAGRVLAVHLAQTLTFSELVDELKKYFSEKKALTIALRAKRGVAHGADLGGYTKDTAYLKGFMALKQYEAQGGDFSPLYYGKIGLEDIPTIQQFAWLVQPKYFPEMIQQKEQKKEETNE